MSLQLIDVRDAQRLVDIIAVTEELFPGLIDIERACEPDDDVGEFTILTVRGGTSDFAELTRRRLEWHDCVSELQPNDSQKVRLSIIPG